MHLRIALLFFFDLFRKRKKKIVFECLTNLIEQLDIDSLTAKDTVDVSSMAINLACEPRDCTPTLVELFTYVLTDVYFVCHAVTRCARLPKAEKHEQYKTTNVEVLHYSLTFCGSSKTLGTPMRHRDDHAIGICITSEVCIGIKTIVHREALT